MNLSNNFTLSEATKSDTALRLGIDNSPPVSMHLGLINVAVTLLQPVREYFNVGFVPSSWFRCEALEKAINWGGRSDSAFGRWCGRHGHPTDDESWDIYFAKKQHPTGQAVDFEVPGVANLALALWIESNLNFDQLILEFYSPDNPRAGWVHASTRLDGNNRRQTLTITRTGTRAGLG